MRPVSSAEAAQARTKKTRCPEDEVREISQIIYAASQNFSVWWALKNKDTRHMHIQTMDKYTQYFLTAINAHFVSTIVPIYCLYESKHDTFNLIKLIEAARTEAKLDTEASKRTDELLAKAVVIWKKIGILRNRAFGHRSKADTISELFQKAQVTADEIRDILDMSRRLLNIVAQAYSIGVCDSISIVKPGDQLLSMLENIRSFHSIEDGRPLPESPLWLE